MFRSIIWMKKVNFRFGRAQSIESTSESKTVMSQRVYHEYGPQILMPLIKQLYCRTCSVFYMLGLKFYFGRLYLPKNFGRKIFTSKEFRFRE